MNSEKYNLKLISKMDWGLATPEFSNGITDTIVHVFNHCLTGEQNIDRAIRFAIGRINWYDIGFMHSSKHEIVFDDIGRNIGDDTRELITEKLMPYATKVIFTSKRG